MMPEALGGVELSKGLVHFPLATQEFVAASHMHSTCDRKLE